MIVFITIYSPIYMIILYTITIYSFSIYLLQKLKEKEAALWKAEQNILSRDKVINELRLRLPASSERDKIIAEINRKDEEPPHALKIAHQTIANMQARLNQKEEVLKKYQQLLVKAREVFMIIRSVPQLLASSLGWVPGCGGRCWKFGSPLCPAEEPACMTLDKLHSPRYANRRKCWKGSP